MNESLITLTGTKISLKRWAEIITEKVVTLKSDRMMTHIHSTLSAV